MSRTPKTPGIATAADLTNCRSTLFFVREDGFKIMVKDDQERLQGTLFVRKSGLSWFQKGQKDAPSIPWDQVSAFLEAGRDKDSAARRPEHDNAQRRNRPKVTRRG